MKKIKRIKAYLKRSNELCEKCKYKYDKQCRGECKGEECVNYDYMEMIPCYCARVADGAPCKHFEKAV